MLDLGSGSGEMLCTWARDHGVIGTGIDMSQLFTKQAKLRAKELGVADQVKFIVKLRGNPWTDRFFAFVRDTRSAAC